MNRMNVKYCLFLCLLFFFGCKTEDVQYEKVSYEVLSDEIMTTMPGSLILTGNFLVWGDPFSRDYFVHVHDKMTGRKIGDMGKVGEGPREFITGVINQVAINNCFFAQDVNGNTKGFLSLDSLVMNKETFVAISDAEKSSRLSMSEFSKDVFIGLTDDGETDYFKADVEGRSFTFGVYPIPEMKQHIGGLMTYDPKENLFLYSSSLFPYLALYQRNADTFELLWERKSDGSEYEISDNQIIFDRTVGGVFEACISKDYIITLERDRKRDPIDETTVGRDVSKCPHTVFLYDYNGNLIKIVDLGIPTMRIAANSESNALYAIGAAPDYVLVKYEL